MWCLLTSILVAKPGVYLYRKSLDPTAHVPSRRKKVNMAGILYTKKQKMSKKILKKNPTLLFGVHSSSFLCPILVSGIIKVINIQGKSQGKCDRLIAETCWSQCYSVLKLTSSCGMALDRLSPESLCRTTSCFFLCLVV